MRKSQNGLLAIELGLIFIIIGLIGGTGWYVFKAKDSTNTAYDKSALGSQVNLSKSSKTTSPKPVSKETPVQTATPPTEPLPDNTAAITHPTNDSCGNSQNYFTVYVSNTNGAKTYQNREFTNPGPVQPYKTKLLITCDLYTPSGYGIVNGAFIKFSDLSLKPI